MAEYEVTTDLASIDFGATGAAEILQNVRMIIATTEFSCPLNRGFAWAPDIDAPIDIAKARTTARLAEAISKYEPRAELVGVTYRGDLQIGTLKPIVRVKIDE